MDALNVENVELMERLRNSEQLLAASQMECMRLRGIVDAQKDQAAAAAGECPVCHLVPRLSIVPDRGSMLRHWCGCCHVLEQRFGRCSHRPNFSTASVSPAVVFSDECSR